eukprot:c17257_g1_i1 orf=654-1517(+)
MAFLLRSNIKKRLLSAALSSCSISERISTSVQEGAQLQQSRLYSRPRGPLWRGKKGIGKEALHVLCDVKRAKHDSLWLGNTLKSKAARLLKTDLLAVLQELQRQHEVDLALKVFNMVRKEVWYKPDIYLYKDMLACLAKAKRVAECETLLKDLKVEGLPPDGLLLTEVMTVYLECGMLPQAMETFDSMRQGSCPPDMPAFKVLLKYLKKMGKKQLREKIRKECLEFYEGIVDNGKKQKYATNEESDEEGFELDCHQGANIEDNDEERGDDFDSSDEESDEERHVQTT